MERLEKILPLSLLSLLVGKALLLGGNVADVGMVSALSLLHGLDVYLSKRKKLQEIQAVVNEQNKVIEKMAVELVTIKDNVGSMKLQNSMRKMA